MKAKGEPATPRQSEYLEAIAALTAELGHPPSAVAIAARLGVSRTGIRSQLKALERKGLLKDVPKEVSSGRWGLTRAAKAQLTIVPPEPSMVDE